MIWCPPTQTLHPHSPKTGGTWVSWALAALAGQANLCRLAGGHDPLRSVTVPDGATVIATVRDPWSYYLSLYYHALGNEPHPELTHYGRGSDAFRDVLWAWTHLSDEVAPAERVGCIWEPPRDEVLASRGLATAGQRYTYLGPADCWIPTDRIRDGFAAFFGRDADDPIWPGVVNAARLHHNNPRPVADMYDEEMIAWVADADRDLICWGDWTFDTPTPWALRRTRGPWETTERRRSPSTPPSAPPARPPQAAAAAPSPHMHT